MIIYKIKVIYLKRDDFPTEGKPINATRASPTRATSKPSPLLALPPPVVGSRSYTIINKYKKKTSDRSLARRAFNTPK